MDLSQRILKARNEAKLTQTELAGKTGHTRAAVQQWERGEVRPRHSTIVKIAEATEQTLAWLESGIAGDASGLMVVGQVAAGVWKEGAVTFAPFSRPVAPDPRYPPEAQRLYEVVGNSVNKLASDGEFLHAVSVAEGGVTPEDGHLVIVKREEHGMAEYTAKILAKSGKRWVLRPYSNDPQWQTDIPFSGDEATNIEVIDVVIARWSAIGRITT